MEITFELVLKGDILSLGCLENKALRLIGYELQVGVATTEEEAPGGGTSLELAAIDPPSLVQDLLSMSPVGLLKQAERRSGEDTRLCLEIRGWGDLVGVLPFLGMSTSPPWGTGSRCNPLTGHWDMTFFLENDAKGSLQPNSNCGRIASWDATTKTLTDAHTGELIAALANYEKVEEICVQGLGLSGNAYASTHWLQVESVGMYCGQHVWWRPAEMKCRIITEQEALLLGPDGRWEKPLAVGPDGYADAVRYRGLLPFPVALEAQDRALACLSDMGTLLFEVQRSLSC